MTLLNPALVGILMFLAAVIWMLRDESDKSRPVLAAAVFFNLFYGSLLSAVMGHADSLLPLKYDYYLYRLDAALGVSAASIALAFGGPWRIWLNLTYELLLPMMILWLALHRNRDRSALVFAYVAELIAAPALYMIVPAVGPAATFGASWLHPPMVDPDVMRLSGMPNAFPSLHLATAFVLLLLARDRMWRLIAVVFLAGTALSTITTGEHYVIDLAAGFSFACFAAAAGRRLITLAATSFGVTACWSVGVRFAGDALILHPAAVKLSALLTLVLSIWAVRTIWQPLVQNEPLLSTAEDGGVTAGYRQAVCGLAPLEGEFD